MLLSYRTSQLISETFVMVDTHMGDGHGLCHCQLAIGFNFKITIERGRQTLNLGGIPL